MARFVRIIDDYVKDIFRGDNQEQGRRESRGSQSRAFKNTESSQQGELDYNQ